MAACDLLLWCSKEGRDKWRIKQSMLQTSIVSQVPCMLLKFPLKSTYYCHCYYVSQHRASDVVVFKNRKISFVLVITRLGKLQRIENIIY